MRRRDFMIIAGSAVANFVRPASGQRLPRIGYLSAQHRPASLSDHVLLNGMKALGYIEGVHYQVDWRYAEGRYDRFPDLTADLVKAAPDVIVATTQLAVRAAQQATATIPIVMAISNDPVQMGLVESIARPGGNTTGATSADEERILKQLDIAMQVVPNLSRLALMFGPGNNNPRRSGSFSALQEFDASARRNAVAVHRVAVRNAGEIGTVFESLKQGQDQALIVRSNPLLNEERAQIAELALAGGLPLLASRAEFAEAGGLISYGESLSNLNRRVAYYVDRILKGARPSDLPVELPSRLSLIVNQRTAKALGLTIPNDLMAVADSIIE